MTVLDVVNLKKISLLVPLTDELAEKSANYSTVTANLGIVDNDGRIITTANDVCMFEEWTDCLQRPTSYEDIR